VYTVHHIYLFKLLGSDTSLCLKYIQLQAQKLLTIYESTVIDSYNGHILCSGWTSYISSTACN
jgi:hypothetical protein